MIVATSFWGRFKFMNITDDLERLGRLHKDGTLSDEEFAQAKLRRLSQPDHREPAPQENLFLEAFNRNRISRRVTGVIVIIIFLIIVLYLRAYYGG